MPVVFDAARLVQDEVQIERPITRPLLLGVLSLAQEG